jgi:hypothetical protein
LVREQCHFRTEARSGIARVGSGGVFLPERRPIAVFVEQRRLFGVAGVAFFSQPSVRHAGGSRQLAKVDVTN